MAAPAAGDALTFEAAARGVLAFAVVCDVLQAFEAAADCVFKALDATAGDVFQAFAAAGGDGDVLVLGTATGGALAFAAAADVCAQAVVALAVVVVAAVCLDAVAAAELAA